MISCARKIAALMVAILWLTGCSEEAPTTTGPLDSVQDVEWFKAHDDKRQVVLEACANNPGELSGTPNCENAVEAESQLSSGSLKNVDNW